MSATIPEFTAAHPDHTVEQLDWTGPMVYLPRQRTVVVPTNLSPQETAAGLTAVEDQLSPVPE